MHFVRLSGLRGHAALRTAGLHRGHCHRADQQELSAALNTHHMSSLFEAGPWDNAEAVAGVHVFDKKRKLLYGDEHDRAAHAEDPSAYSAPREEHRPPSTTATRGAPSGLVGEREVSLPDMPPRCRRRARSAARQSARPDDASKPAVESVANGPSYDRSACISPTITVSRSRWPCTSPRPCKNDSAGSS